MRASPEAANLEEPRANRARAKHLIPLVVGLSLLGLLVYVGGGESLRQLGRLRPMPVVGALCATIGLTASITARWGALVNALAKRRVAGWLDYHYYFVVGLGLGLFLPRDVIDVSSRTIWLNRRHALPLSLSGASVLLDRICDLGVILMFLPAALLYWLGVVSDRSAIALALCAVVVVAGWTLVGHKQTLRALSWLWQMGLRIAHFVPWVRRLSLGVPDFSGLDLAILLRIYALSLAKFACTAVRLYLCALALGLPIPPLQILFGVPVGQISYLFAFTPGGLGIFEAGWFAILTIGGVPMASVTAFVVGQRVLITALVGTLALVSQIAFTLRSRDRGIVADARRRQVQARSGSRGLGSEFTGLGSDPSASEDSGE